MNCSQLFTCGNSDRTAVAHAVRELAEEKAGGTWGNRCYKSAESTRRSPCRSPVMEPRWHKSMRCTPNRPPLPRAASRSGQRNFVQDDLVDQVGERAVPHHIGHEGGRILRRSLGGGEVRLAAILRSGWPQTQCDGLDWASLEKVEEEGRAQLVWLLKRVVLVTELAFAKICVMPGLAAVMVA